MHDTLTRGKWIPPIWINDQWLLTLQSSTPLVEPDKPTGFVAEVGSATVEIFPSKPVMNEYQQIQPVAYAGNGA